MNFFLRITGTFSLIFVGCKRDHLYDHLPFILDWRPGLLPASWELWGMSFGLVPVAAPEIDVRCAQVMKEHSLPINISLSESVCLSFVIKLATVQGAWCGERAEWGMPHAVASFGCPCAAHKLVGEFFMLPQHDNVTRPPTYVLSLCHAPSPGYPADVFAHFAFYLGKVSLPIAIAMPSPFALAHKWKLMLAQDFSRHIVKCVDSIKMRDEVRLGRRRRVVCSVCGPQTHFKCNTIALSRRRRLKLRLHLIALMPHGAPCHQPPVSQSVSQSLRQSGSSSLHQSSVFHAHYEPKSESGAREPDWN